MRLKSGNQIKRLQYLDRVVAYVEGEAKTTPNTGRQENGSRNSVKHRGDLSAGSHHFKIDRP